MLARILLFGKPWGYHRLVIHVTWVAPDLRGWQMSRKAMIATLGLLAALNILGVAVNLSQASKAAIPSFQELMDNADFARAVKAIAEQRVNVDIGRLQC
jgi:hypothetical protein